VKVRVKERVQLAWYRFASHLKINGKLKHIGTYDTRHEAHDAAVNHLKQMDPERGPCRRFFNPTGLGAVGVGSVTEARLKEGWEVRVRKEGWVEEGCVLPL
jgi:hypothetical protein